MVYTDDMHTTLLFIHVILALITLVTSLAAYQAVRHQRPARKQLIGMWGSFAGVAVTGGALVIMTPNALGHACALLSVYVVLTSCVQLYQTQAVRAT